MKMLPFLVFSYPMELHMVFYNADYGGISEAIDHPDGLCVLSFLYSVNMKTILFLRS